MGMSFRNSPAWSLKGAGRGRTSSGTSPRVTTSDTARRRFGVRCNEPPGKQQTSPGEHGHGSFLPPTPLVECKLWKNPEARRQVVAQTLDYVSALSRWSYADLQAKVAAALRKARE